MTLSYRHTRTGLIVVFILGFFANVLSILYLYFNGGLEDYDATNTIVVTAEIYSIPLGVILAGIFAQNRDPDEPVNRNIFLVAIVMSLTWNLLLIWRSLAFVMASFPDITLYIDELKNLANKSLFMVAGILAYFFAKK